MIATKLLLNRCFYNGYEDFNLIDYKSEDGDWYDVPFCTAYQEYDCPFPSTFKFNLIFKEVGEDHLELFIYLKDSCVGFKLHQVCTFLDGMFAFWDSFDDILVKAAEHIVDMLHWDNMVLLYTYDIKRKPATSDDPEDLDETGFLGLPFA